MPQLFIIFTRNNCICHNYLFMRTNQGKNYHPRDKSTLTQHNITLAMLSKWFKYASPNSFYGSKAKDDIISGVLEVLKHMENSK